MSIHAHAGCVHECMQTMRMNSKANILDAIVHTNTQDLGQADILRGERLIDDSAIVHSNALDCMHDWGREGGGKGVAGGGAVPVML